MKPAECRTLYHPGSVPEITLRGQLRRLPLLQNLLKKVKHTLHFCARTANHADKCRDFNTAAYFKAELEDKAAEDVDAWGVGAGPACGLSGSR